MAHVARHGRFSLKGPFLRPTQRGGIGGLAWEFASPRFYGPVCPAPTFYSALLPISLLARCASCGPHRLSAIPWRWPRLGLLLHSIPQHGSICQLLWGCSLCSIPHRFLSGVVFPSSYSQRLSLCSGCAVLSRGFPPRSFSSLCIRGGTAHVLPVVSHPTSIELLWWRHLRKAFRFPQGASPGLFLFRSLRRRASLPDAFCDRDSPSCCVASRVLFI